MLNEPSIALILPGNAPKYNKHSGSIPKLTVVFPSKAPLPSVLSTVVVCTTEPPASYSG